MRKKDELHTWISSYNFICVTNILEKMHKFSPISNYGEGVGSGEKIIQLIKP